MEVSPDYGHFHGCFHTYTSACICFDGPRGPSIIRYLLGLAYRSVYRSKTTEVLGV